MSVNHFCSARIDSSCTQKHTGSGFMLKRLIRFLLISKIDTRQKVTWNGKCFCQRSFTFGRFRPRPESGEHKEKRQYQAYCLQDFHASLGLERITIYCSSGLICKQKETLQYLIMKYLYQWRRETDRVKARPFKPADVLILQVNTTFLNVLYSHSSQQSCALNRRTRCSKPWPRSEWIISCHFRSHLVHHSDTPRQTPGLSPTEEETVQLSVNEMHHGYRRI